MRNYLSLWLNALISSTGSKVDPTEFDHYQGDWDDRWDSKPPGDRKDLDTEYLPEREIWH